MQINSRLPTDLRKLSNVVDNDIFKKNVITKGYHSYQNYQLVTKVNTIDTKILCTSGLVTKHTIIQIKKKLKMLTERYPILMGWSRRLITTQQLQRSKTRYLALLIDSIASVPTAAVNTKFTKIEIKKSDIATMATKPALNTKAKEIEKKP